MRPHFASRGLKLALLALAAAAASTAVVAAAAPKAPPDAASGRGPTTGMLPRAKLTLKSAISDAQRADSGAKSVRSGRRALQGSAELRSEARRRSGAEGLPPREVQSGGRRGTRL